MSRANTCRRASAWAELERFGERYSTAKTDREWLLECLERNADTEFGRKHEFSAIDGLEVFRAAVPIGSHADFAPDIERMAGGAADVLLRGRPAAFELTSGSSGPAKLIPYSEQSFHDFRVGLLPWLARLIRRFRLRGSLYWSISPALRAPQCTVGGIPLGVSDAAYIGAEAASSIAALNAVPFWVGELEEAGQWRLATLYHLLRAPDLCFVSIWSPTFFSSLLSVLESPADSEALLALLGRGGRLAGRELPADSAAARRLERYLGGGAKKDTNLLWPELALISAWADASATPYFAALRGLFPQAAFEGKGLLATEGLVTTPGESGLASPPAGCGLSEFLDEAGRAFWGHELQPGGCYRVVITTAGGLYRYDLGDLARCRGFEAGRPLLEFMGRPGLVSDLTGEKLGEAFVGACLEGIPGFRLLAPCRLGHEGRPGYLLVLTAADDPELLCREVEARLRANPHYAWSRDSGQLAPLRHLIAPDALERYINSRAGKLAVIKTPALAADAAWLDEAQPQEAKP